MVQQNQHKTTAFLAVIKILIPVQCTHVHVCKHCIHVHVCIKAELIHENKRRQKAIFMQNFVSKFKRILPYCIHVSFLWNKSLPTKLLLAIQRVRNSSLPTRLWLAIFWLEQSLAYSNWSRHQQYNITVVHNQLS